LRNLKFICLLAGVCLAVPGCDVNTPKVRIETEYQAVFLDNGQIFYGKLEGAGGTYPLLRDVHYIQRQTDPETKEVRNVLLRRGSEWHAPNLMYLNDRHIVAIEPVTKDSQVAKMIAQSIGKPQQ
jgi:hypothetical protein